MFAILSFTFGASIGSFVQVIVTRLNVAKAINARSKCLSCGEALRVLDLIPIFSYLSLRGRCRYCKTPYGAASIVIELSYGLIFLLVYYFILKGAPSLGSAFMWLLYYSFLFASLGVIALYDLAHTFLPTLYLGIFTVLTAVMMLLRFAESGEIAVFFSPLIVALPLFILWLVTKGKGLGFGDVVLFFGIGAFFGIAQGFAVLLLSVWIGALFGIAIMLLRKKNGTNATTIPFVPYIVAAFIITLFTDIDIFSIAQIFA